MIAPGSQLLLYNGATGGLGRHVSGAADAAGFAAHALAARLEDDAGLAQELAALGSLEPPAVVHFVHLAARVSVPACEADPAGAREVNVVLAAAVLDRVLTWAERRAIEVRVTYVSTGHVYAVPRERTRVPEDAPTAPRSVYASTKLEAEAAFRDRTARSGAPLVIARVFGLLAPGQPSNYVLPGLIARVRDGRLDAIPGLDVVRDYLDARDVCRALLALSTAAMPNAASPREGDVVNVCSGEALTIRELLRAVLLATGDPDAPQRAGAATAAPGRPDDVRWLVGDPRRFTRRTGLAPRTIALETTVRDAIAAAP